MKQQQPDIFQNVEIKIKDNKRLKPNRLEYALFMGLILAIVLTCLSSFSSICNEIRSDTLRLHILANSNSENDQRLKLKVRDAVLQKTTELFGTSIDKSKAINNAENNLKEIENTARETIVREGYNYPVKAYVTNMYFATTHYDGFTMPAGRYDAVRVEIGSAKGKNWWCVLFPPLCVPAATAESQFDAVYSGDEKKVLTGSYEVRFAAVEWVENIKNALDTDTDKTVKSESKNEIKQQ